MTQENKPKTVNEWFLKDPYGDGQVTIGSYLTEDQKEIARQAWSAAEEGISAEYDERLKAMQDELKFYKSSEYFTAVLFSKSAAFGDKSPIEYAIENKSTEYLKATLGRMLGGDANYHRKLEAMQTEIDKRDKILEQCLAIVSQRDPEINTHKQASDLVEEIIKKELNQR